MNKYKFTQLSKHSQITAMEEYAADFYDATLDEINLRELRELLSKDRPDDNYDINGLFVSEDN